MKTLAARVVSSALLLATTVPAQRAPFTGTVSGLDGKPLANAQVVCAWQPGFASTGTSDRCEATTDAAGHFVCDLVPGCAYVVWAIGRPGAGGTREVVLPSAVGAAGKQLDLRAGMRMAPVSLQITGTSPWIAEGPLAVRIAVADHIALGPDVAIPGDGNIVLPPLPTDEIRVALVDGRGSPLGMHFVDTHQTTAIAFAEPREFDVSVENDAGQPIAGAQVLSQTRDMLPPAQARAGDARTRRDVRVVATTDGDGRAHCRTAVANENVFLFAERTGHASAASGWFGTKRFENGKAAAGDDDDRPLRFALGAREPTTVRVVGAEARDDVDVRFSGFAEIRVGNRMAGMPLTYATSVVDGMFRCEGGTATDAVVAHVAVRRAQQVPHATIAYVYGTGPKLPDIDLRAMRTFDVRLTDAAGAAVPCGQVDVAHHGHTDVVGTLITDPAGRAEVRIADDDLLLYATTSTHFGLAILARGVASGPVPITMRPMATMRLRVVDTKAAPVAGARIEVASAIGALDKPRPGQSAEDHTLECLAFALAHRQPPSDGRTDSNGEIVLRFASSHAVIKLRARLGALQSEPIERRAGDEPRELVLQ